MPFSVGPMEIVIVLAIALIVLGPKRLPDAGRSLGRGIREFKGAITGGGGDLAPVERAEHVDGETGAQTRPLPAGTGHLHPAADRVDAVEQAA